MATNSFHEIVLKNFSKKVQEPFSDVPDDNMASSSEYSLVIMQTLNEYRKAGKFCDVCLAVEDTEAMAHRNVLAASSPFFESLLSTKMKEKDQYKIVLAGLKADILNEVLDYVYLGEISLSVEKVFDLIVAADYLMLRRLKHLSVDFLVKDHLNFDNCLSTWIFADRYQCPWLRSKARELVLANFFNVSKSEEFSGLDASYLVELMGCEGLAASDREALDAILAWINHNVNKRQKYFEQLIGNIDLANIPHSYVDEVTASNQYANSSEMFKNVIKCGRDYYMKCNDDTDNDQHRKLHRESVSFHGNVAILIVGGWEHGKGGVANVNCYLPSVNKWFHLPNMSIPRYRHGIAVNNGIVYAFGGSLAASDSCVECLDLTQANMLWKRLLPMCSGHIGLAVASLKSHIYVSGGFCGRTLNTVQRYSLMHNTWETVSPMMQAREGHCLIACSSYVYAIGGSCGQDKSEVLKGVERYTPHLDSWLPMSPMKTQRYGACGAELHHRIYIFGGQLNVYTEGPMIQTNFRSCEVYSPRFDQWEVIADMKIPRLRSCAAVVGHKIYVFGGYLHGGYLDTVECYDSRKGLWHIATMVPSKLEGASCCSVQLDGKIISMLLQSQSGEKSL